MGFRDSAFETSEFQEFMNSGVRVFRIQGTHDFRISEIWEFGISRFQDIGLQDVRMSGIRENPNSRVQETRSSGSLEFLINKAFYFPMVLNQYSNKSSAWPILTQPLTLNQYLSISPVFNQHLTVFLILIQYLKAHSCLANT